MTQSTKQKIVAVKTRVNAGMLCTNENLVAVKTGVNAGNVLCTNEK